MKRHCKFLLLISLIISMTALSAALAGWNEMIVCTENEGIPVYSSHSNGRRIGVLFNGYDASLSLVEKNGMYSCDLTSDVTVWVNQDKAMGQFPINENDFWDYSGWRKSIDKQPCSAFIAEVIQPSAPLYTSLQHKTLIAKHAPGTILKIYGEFSDDYYIDMGSYQGFISKKNVRFLKRLTAREAYEDKALGLETQQKTVYTGGGELAIAYSATGYCAVKPATVKNGEQVHVLRQLGDWSQLTNDAFIETRFLDPAGDHSIRYATVKSSKVLNRLNVRWSPQEDSPVAAKLCSGAKVQVPSQTDEWAAVFLTGNNGGEKLSGSVRLEYLSFDDTPVQNGCVRVRLTNKQYVKGRDLNVGEELSVIGMHLESWVNSDTFICLTDDEQLITIENEEGVLEPVERVGVIAKVKSNVRFREKPNKDAEAIRTLSKGTKVEILLRGEEWTMIEYKNKTGYVMSRYLSFP